MNHIHIQRKKCGMDYFSSHQKTEKNTTELLIMDKQNI